MQESSDWATRRRRHPQVRRGEPRRLKRVLFDSVNASPLPRIKRSIRVGLTQFQEENFLPFFIGGIIPVALPTTSNFSNGGSEIIPVCRQLGTRQVQTPAAVGRVAEGSGKLDVAGGRERDLTVRQDAGGKPQAGGGRASADFAIADGLFARGRSEDGAV